MEKGEEGQVDCVCVCVWKANEYMLLNTQIPEYFHESVYKVYE